MTVESSNTFSFVDRISSIDSTGLIKGHFVIPKTLDSFPQCLVAEAVGQLAAWYAMSCQAFAYRPVAALAGATIFNAEAMPGKRLDLLAQIERCDMDTVSYSGVAICGDRLIMELKDCIGMMLPQTGFADPVSVERHYRQLVAVGTNNNRVDVAKDVFPTDIYIDNLRRIRGRLNVPLDADFFRDHFPYQPVFPATLLIQALSTMVIKHLNTTDTGFHAKLMSVEGIKVRKWIYPGEQLQLEAIDLTRSSSCRLLKVKAYRSDKVIASANARIDCRESLRTC